MAPERAQAPIHAGYRGFLALCEWIGFELEPFQRRIAKALLGPQRETLILLPRTNGKSRLVGTAAVHHLLTTEKPAVYVAASSRDQARVSRSSGATPSRRFACAGNATPSARRIANLDPNRARDREEIAVRANDQTAKQQAEQMAEMMKGGAGVTAQGAGMDLGAAIQQAAGAAGQQAKPAAYDAAGQIEKLSQLHDSGSLSDEEFADAKRKLLEDL